MSRKENSWRKLKEDYVSLNEELSLVNKPSKLVACGICDEQFQIMNNQRQHIEIIHVNDRIN